MPTPRRRPRRTGDCDERCSEAEREVFVQLRDDRRIDDEVLRRVLFELDLEEAMLARD